MFAGAPPYYPTGRKQLENMFKLAKLKPEDKVIDIGSGDGRIVIKASKYSKDVTGIDYNPFLNQIAKLRLRLTKKKGKVRIIFGNLYNHNLSNYDVIFCYLLPGTMQKLKEKFKKELKPGTRIITNTFTMKDWKPTEESGKAKLYVIN